MLLSTRVKALKRKGRSSTINLQTKTKTTRAQLLKYATRVMVDIDMSSMSPKVIGREACLQIGSLFEL